MTALRTLLSRPVCSRFQLKTFSPSLRHLYTCKMARDCVTCSLHTITCVACATRIAPTVEARVDKMTTPMAKKRRHVSIERADEVAIRVFASAGSSGRAVSQEADYKRYAAGQLQAHHQNYWYWCQQMYAALKHRRRSKQLAAASVITDNDDGEDAVQVIKVEF